MIDANMPNNMTNNMTNMTNDYGYNDTYGNGTYGKDHGGKYDYSDKGEGRENEIHMDMGDLGDARATQKDGETEFRMKSGDIEMEAKMRDGETEVEVALPGDMEL